MNKQSNIERVVMRRVHSIRLLRLIVSTGTLSVLVGVLSLWGIGREVWVAQVFQNMPHSGDVISVIRFCLSAFGHTRFAVQALTLLTVLSTVYFVRECSRLFSRTLTPARI